MSIVINPPIRDSGYNGSLVSLAGIVGAFGQGRNVVTGQYVNETTTPAVVLNANPKRIWASIQNTGSAATTLSYGEGGSFKEFVNMQPWDIYVIDADHPWTGSVAISSTDINLLFAEVSIGGT
jgi:hypothetical protein